MATQRILIKRGLKANLPTTGMLAGELMFTTDQSTLHVATAATTAVPVVPAVDLLTTLASIDGTADLIMVYDASEASLPKVKKILFNDFKTALSIPSGSTDEKVAVVSGGASGYLWGTDGTNGLIRFSTGVTITKDAGNAFITIDAATIDGGTF